MTTGRRAYRLLVTQAPSGSHADRLAGQLATRAHRAERLLVEAVVLALLGGTLAGLAGGIYVADRVALRVPCSQEVAP